MELESSMHGVERRTVGLVSLRKLSEVKECEVKYRSEEVNS